MRTDSTPGGYITLHGDPPFRMAACDVHNRATFWINLVFVFAIMETELNTARQLGSRQSNITPDITRTWTKTSLSPGLNLFFNINFSNTCY